MTARSDILQRLIEFDGEPKTVPQIGRPLGYADNTTAKELKLLRTEGGYPIMRRFVDGKKYKVYWMKTEESINGLPIHKEVELEAKPEQNPAKWYMHDEICKCGKSHYSVDGSCNICGEDRPIIKTQTKAFNAMKKPKGRVRRV